MKNIQFTFEEENYETIPLSDILISRKRNYITTKQQYIENQHVYLNWNTSAPATWKRETLKAFVERTCVICSIGQRSERVKISRKSISWEKQLS